MQATTSGGPGGLQLTNPYDSPSRSRITNRRRRGVRRYVALGTLLLFSAVVIAVPDLKVSERSAWFSRSHATLPITKCLLELGEL